MMFGSLPHSPIIKINSYFLYWCLDYLFSKDKIAVLFLSKENKCKIILLKKRSVFFLWLNETRDFDSMFQYHENIFSSHRVEKPIKNILFAKY